MKQAVILGVDLSASIIVVLWYLLGPWIDLYGFSVYHSRGDVWLPTPPLARAFFARMVLTETLVFVAFLILVSILAFCFRRFPLHDAFYGNGSKLLIKYCAFLLGAITLPFALDAMRRFGTTREFYISTGLGIALVSFILVCMVGNSFFAPQRRQNAPAGLARSLG